MKRAMISAILLSGCATGMVDEVSRDRDGSFDGTWIMTATKTDPIQRIDNWRMTCSHQPYTYRFLVRDGTVRSDGLVFYIGETGEFRFEFPTDHVVRESLFSDVNLRSKVTFIYEGFLNSGIDAGYGLATAGIAQFNNRGCTTKIKIEKVPAS